jgi:D-glycerate 3-kinase
MSRAERTENILSRVLPSITRHQELLEKQGRQQPFILALTGLQGCGKSTLSTDIVEALNEKHNCRAIEVSLDDFYLTHPERQELQKSSDGRLANSLLKFRGQPGTHDCVLARKILDQFSGKDTTASERKAITLPIFDKSLFNGNGDRLPESQWRVLDPEPPIQVLVFEGWCVGFQPLSEQEVETKWREANNQRKTDRETEDKEQGVEKNFSITTLADHTVEDLQFVNSCLESYCDQFMGPRYFDFLIHLDTNDLVNVYRWRMEQEHMLWKVKGTGMTDSQVVAFGKLIYQSRRRALLTCRSARVYAGI